MKRRITRKISEVLLVGRFDLNTMLTAYSGMVVSMGGAVAISRDHAESVLILLQELETRRLSDPIPCTKYLNLTINKQFRHIVQELDEVSDAGKVFTMTNDDNDKQHLAEELTDLINSAVTALKIIGYGQEERWRIQRAVTAKNEARGYYTNNIKVNERSID